MASRTVASVVSASQSMVRSVVESAGFSWLREREFPAVRDHEASWLGKLSTGDASGKQ